MNIGQAYRVLSEAIIDLELKFYEYPEKQQTFDFLFYNTKEFRNSINAVLKFSPFLIDTEEYIWLKYILDAADKSENITTNKEDGNKIIRSATLVRKRVLDYLSYLSNFVDIDKGDNTLIIKFTHIKDLSEFEKTISQLKRALNVPVFELDGRTEIGSVESGSIIIDIVIFGGAATTILKMIGTLLESAVKLKNLYNQGQATVQQVKMLGIKNEMLQEIINKTKDNYRDNSNAVASEVIEEFIPEKNSPENRASFKDSIELFGALLEKGAQFYPSLKAADEAKRLFPSPEAQKSIASSQKQIEDSSEEKGKNDNSSEQTDN